MRATQKDQACAWLAAGILFFRDVQSGLNPRQLFEVDVKIVWVLDAAGMHKEVPDAGSIDLFPYPFAPPDHSKTHFSHRLGGVCHMMHKCAGLVGLKQYL